jgi:hypothetical protein
MNEHQERQENEVHLKPKARGNCQCNWNKEQEVRLILRKLHKDFKKRNENVKVHVTC